ncbi:MAG TPA: DNA polymerase III subunit beta [Candidatus Saccharimonadales bacterium]|nr:DNA polymerase III subunit beta [Candidatus Saccharimonadales bacterium]
MEAKTTKILTENLKTAVNIANRFVSLRPSVAALGNILLKSSKGKIEFFSTNLESSIALSEVASGEDWETTVPAKIFVELVNTLKEKETSLAVEKETLQLVSGATKATFNTIAASEFPTIQLSGDKLKKDLSQKTLAEIVGKIAFAATVEETKPVLTGILIRSKGGKTLLVATDSYRLAIGTLNESLGEEEMLVPAKTLVEALKIAGELQEESIGIGTSEENNQLLFAGDNFQIATRLIDGVYPAYEQIIPDTFVASVKVSKDALTDALKTASVLSRDIGNVVRLKLKAPQQLVIEGDTAQIGQAVTEVEAEVTGEELTVAFNSNFLLDGLSSLKEAEVEIKFSGVLKPAVFENSKKDFKYVVMPVRAQR